MTKQSTDAVVAALSELLANSYTLYLKTHNYHWNVVGPMFSALHNLFEEQYTDLATAVDDIAERIRILGAPAPGSYSAFAKLSAVQEENGQPDAMTMISNLAGDQKLIADCARKVIEAATAIGDDATADLATGRIEVHEKNGWMLRSHLK